MIVAVISRLNAGPVPHSRGDRVSLAFQDMASDHLAVPRPGRHLVESILSSDRPIELS